MKQALITTLRIALPALLVLLVTIDIADAQRMNRGGQGGRGDRLGGRSDRGGRGNRGSGESGWKFVAKKYDADKDGSVSLSEYTRGEAAFKELDANSDGVLDERDWQGRSNRKPAGAAPREGDSAPSFSLTSIRDADSKVTLSDFAGKKPVALLFGSCT